MKIERHNYLKLRSSFTERFITDLNSFIRTGYQNVHADNLLDDFQSLIETVSSFKDFKAMHQLYYVKNYLHNDKVQSAINELRAVEETNVIPQPQNQN